MSRPGRPRRNGQRESNGRLRRHKLSERDPAVVEKLQVLAQSHRNGDADQFCESALGRFVLRHKLHRAVYDAGLEYGNLVRHFFTAKTPVRPMVQLGFGSGRGVTAEKAKFLSGEIARIEMPLRRLSPIGFAGAQNLCIFEKDCHPGSSPEVISTLLSLAKLLRKLDDRTGRIQHWRPLA